MSTIARLGFLLLFLYGCSSTRLAPVPLAAMVLLPPQDIAGPLLLKRKVIMQAAVGEMQFLMVARFDTERLNLVALLPSGQPLLTLNYDGLELVQQSNAPVEIPGRDILAIIQFANWPEESIRRHYRSAEGWILELEANSRILSTPGGVFLKIDRQGEELIVDNFAHNYRVLVYPL